MKISVVGAGSWGSALAELAGRSGHDVLLWAHDPAVAVAIRESGSNPVYLPSAKFGDNVGVTNSLEEAGRFANTVLMVTPSHHYRTVLSGLSPHLGPRVRILSGTKGIENETLKRVSEMSADVLGARLEHFAVLSGPTFAAEVSRGDPTTAVVACAREEFAEEIQRELSCGTFRVYRSQDVVGVELAGALKNVVAIAAGVVEGTGLGSNTTAALITRGLHEIRRLGSALGGLPETFSGLAGMGDLVLTCTGSLSRNRAVGIELGRGRTLNDILSSSRLVAEGVRTCRSARDLGLRHDIELPIISEMYRVLYEAESPRNAIQRLMSRSLKPELK